MGLKKYFTGKSGAIFWVNVVIAALILISIPVVLFNTLDAYTNHGQKVSVPSVIGLKYYEAEEMLDDNGFVAVISDSIYDKKSKPGVVLDQAPKPGNLIKSGRLIYLTINLNGEPLAKLPDLVGNSSYREAEIQLQVLGFKLTEPELVDGIEKDQIVKIKQGNRIVHANEMISKERALTLYIGAGEEQQDTVSFDDGTVRYNKDADLSESNFDIQL